MLICNGAETCTLNCDCKLPHEPNDNCIDMGGRDLKVRCIHRNHSHGEYQECKHVEVEDEDNGE